MWLLRSWSLLQFLKTRARNSIQFYMPKKSFTSPKHKTIIVSLFHHAKLDQIIDYISLSDLAVKKGTVKFATQF